MSSLPLSEPAQTMGEFALRPRSRNASFDAETLPAGVKWSFVTRNVPIDAVSHVEMRMQHAPQPGDLVLARVQKISQHTRIQLRCGRRSLLYQGDLLLLAYGHRYAPDQFEAEIPQDLDECHLVAGGGIAARAVSKHSGLKWPTSIRPEGLCIGAAGEVANLRDYGVQAYSSGPRTRKPVVAVLGTSMNAGKTTAAASLTRGLTLADRRVATVKATGTGAGNDLWAYQDAGAHLVLDFTDAGHPSTFRLPAAVIEACFARLLDIALSQSDVDVVVVEIADGLLQPETEALVRSRTYADYVTQTLFASGDAMGAVAGVQILGSLGVRPGAIVGLVTASQLAAAEAAKATGIDTFSKSQLESPQRSVHLLA